MYCRWLCPGKISCAVLQTSNLLCSRGVGSVLFGRYFASELTSELSVLVYKMESPEIYCPTGFFCVAALLIVALICLRREAEMRTVSETTNSRVVWFSTLSLWVCIAVSVLQVRHLQGFFRKKKLI
jgi:hypothetical protein